MRDWRATATNFDNLAFDTAATGQFLPLMRIDTTLQPPQSVTWFGLPAYVGETRTFGETGEPIHEAISSLGAVLGGTLLGVDKTAGPYNWVAMSREYYVDRNSQFVVLNTPFSASGQSAWYETYPSILFYSIADRYPGEASLQTALNTVDARFYSAVNKLTAGGTSPNFNYTAYNFKIEQPVYNGVWREPDMGLGMAWLQHAAYWRNHVSNPSQAAAHLNAVDWSLKYYEQTSSNPDYEILVPFGAYTAARMNAEHGRNYDIHKLMKWVFERSSVRPTKIMISGEQWGGQDVGGLMGFTVPNTGAQVRGYAFAMNTFATAMPIVPLARYEDRYSRAIGKWMLNAANAARLFYADEHSPQTQSSEFWTGDPQSSVAYEGLRHHWLGGEFDGEEQYAAGDPLTYGWGPQTDFGIYGSAVSGVFGSIIKTTNVEKILQLDLLATDFYRDAAHSTYLYYNPYATNKSVAIDLGGGSSVDLYDAVSNQYLKRGASGQTFFNIPSDDAVMLVLVPSGGTQTRQGRRLLINGVVIDHNASLLPNNLVRNPDVDSPLTNNPNRPSFWHYSNNATWSGEEALSPSHSLKLVDSNANSAEEWRSYSTAIPAGEDRSLQLRWFWKYNIAAGTEFLARLRLSDDDVTSLDLTNPNFQFEFTVSGATADFEMFETTIALPDGTESFDLTFITGALVASGVIYIDDISVSLVRTPPLLGDYNVDGIVDAADYIVWRDTLGQSGSGLAADGNGSGTIDEGDYHVWRMHYGETVGSVAGTSANAAVPEPTSRVMLIIGVLAMFFRRRAVVS